MKLQNKYKIALVGYRLSGGGSDKVMVNLSKYLESLGIEVFVITVLDQGEADYGGTYLSTQQFKVDNGLFGRISRAKALKAFFRKQKFDYIIDFRFRNKIIQELLLAKYVYNAPTVFTVHSWATDHYIPNNKWIAKWMYGKSKAIVTVSKAIENKLRDIYSFPQLTTIYNPFLPEEFPQRSECMDSKTILFVGQLDDDTKQLEHLLKAFAMSNLKENNAVIRICGTGKKILYYLSLAKELEIEQHVTFLGFVSPPYQEMISAKFLVVCSAFEGFPNVIVEALNNELPVVSYNLNSGPSEIIQHKKNGLLVDNQSIENLALNMKLFFDDVDLYRVCKSNTRKSVERFSMKNIGEDWVKLLNLS